MMYRTEEPFLRCKILRDQIENHEKWTPQEEIGFANTLRLKL
jgi:hypothetical protein